MNNSGIAQLFDLVGSEFDNKDLVFEKHYKQMAIVCQASFTSEEIEGKSVLDAGCGTGTAAVYFARNKANSVFGIDISEKSLTVGRRWGERHQLKNLFFRQADILKLPFADGSFDVVFSCGAIPYVSDVFAAIDEFTRVTKKNGTLVLFLLKRGAMDGAYETARKILSKTPIKVAKVFSEVLSVALLPFAGFFLKREVGVVNGKPLSQTILENLFSPVGLTKIDPRAVRDYFEQNGFRVEEVRGINGVDFYSTETIFLCKARRS